MQCTVDLINHQMIKKRPKRLVICHLVNCYFALNKPSISVPKISCYGNKDQLLKISKMINIYLQKKAYEYMSKATGFIPSS